VGFQWGSRPWLPFCFGQGLSKQSAQAGTPAPLNPAFVRLMQEVSSADGRC